jgi:rod shape-determining protein MreD
LALSITSREQFEVYRFNPLVALAVPLLAIFVQAYLPLKISFFNIFDLPLLVTIFFAVARRNPVSGLLTGMIIGLLQDSLTHSFLGLYGIAKTVVGFAASSLGVKIDVENPGSRLLMTAGFYLVQKVVYYSVARGMARMDLQFDLPHILGAALANGFLAIVMFSLLDKTKQRS